MHRTAGKSQSEAEVVSLIYSEDKRVVYVYETYSSNRITQSILARKKSLRVYAMKMDEWKPTEILR